MRAGSAPRKRGATGSGPCSVLLAAACLAATLALPPYVAALPAFAPPGVAAALPPLVPPAVAVAVPPIAPDAVAVATQPLAPLAVAAAEPEPDAPPPDSLRATLPQLWRWRELERDEAMPSFRSARSDPQGGLVVADAEGLWNYDGRCWTLIPGSEELTLSGLVDAVRLDHGWVLSRSNGLTWFAPATSERRHAVVRQLAAGVEGFTPPVTAPDGRLVAVVGTRIVAIDPEADTLPEYLPSPPGASRLWGLGFDAQGQAWCVTNIGVLRHDADGWHVEQPLGMDRSPTDLERVVPLGERLVLLPPVFSSEHAGLIWDGRRLRRLPSAEAQGEVQDVLVTPAGELLVLVRHAGVRLLDGETWRRIDLPTWFDDSLVSVTLDCEGRLAAVTLMGRLLLHDHASRRWERFDPWESTGVSSIVNALAPSRRGGYWLGTHEGVVRFADGRFHEAFRTAADVDLPLFGITDVHEDERGHLWVSAGGDMVGLLRWDGERWHHHSQPHVFGGSGVHGMEQAPDGSLWCLLLSQDSNDYFTGGIAIWDGRDWRVEHGPAARGFDRTYSVTFTAQGHPIVGLFEGVASYDGSAWRVEPQQPFGKGSKAFCLFREQDGTIWSGLDLKSPGLARRRPGAAGWEVMRGPGWSDAGAGDIAQTRDGDLWFAAEAGLFRARGDLCLRVPTNGVVPGGSFWPLEVDPDDDSLWIGSLGGGLLHLSPDDHDGPVSHAVGVVLPDPDVPGTRRVTWRSADAWASTPASALRHRVRLDGAPWDAWSLPGAPSERLLEGLSPGPHRFEIQGLDASGNLEQPPLVIPIDVPPPPTPLWRQPAMLALATLLLLSSASVIALVVRRRREQRAETQARTELNARLRELTSRLMSTQEEERRRISRDLHDDLGQLLTVTALQLEHGMTQADAAKRGDALRRALASAHAAIDSVRSLAARVRPTSLDDLGLEAAVRGTLEEFASSTGLAVTADLAFDEVEIPDTAASHVYRILKEGLTNVVRHAGAQRVDVTLSVTDRAIDLSLRDDGRGFRPPAGPATEGLGLVGMRERAEALRGRFSVSSAPDRGTEISVWIPLVDASNRGGEA